MAGPIDPNSWFPSAKLPKPLSFEHWRNRTVCRLLGRLAREDFDFGFDTVVDWMAVDGGRRISLEQARHSAADIIMATCGVFPSVMVVKDEDTGMVIMTVSVRGPTGEKVHERTRRIKIHDLQDAAEPEPIQFKRKRA